MRPVRADFKRRFVPPVWWWWTLALVGVAAAVAAFVVGREWQRVNAQREVLRQTLATKATAPTLAPEARPSAPYDTSARGMLAELAAPWPQALSAIEATTIVGVTPIALEFVAAESSVRMEASFTDYAKLLEYVDALNAGEPDFRWALVQSQAPAAGAATAVVFGSQVRR